jgi:hypothetical protein
MRYCRHAYRNRLADIYSNQHQQANVAHNFDDYGEYHSIDGDDDDGYLDDPSACLDLDENDNFNWSGGNDIHEFDQTGDSSSSSFVSAASEEWSIDNSSNQVNNVSIQIEAVEELDNMWHHQTSSTGICVDSHDNYVSITNQGTRNSYNDDEWDDL